MNTFRFFVNYAQDPVALLVVTLVFGIIWRAYSAVLDIVESVGAWRDRRQHRQMAGVFETYGLVYRIGSPQSHADRTAA